MKATHEIPVWNLEAVYAKIEKLNRRAVKLGVPEIVVEEGERRTEENRDPITNKITETCEWIKLTVTGEEIVIAGWKFLARIWHLGDEGNIVESVPGANIPRRYRAGGPKCEHCNLNRRRKDTFLVRNVESGEVKQVGSTCLGDFLGVDPHAIIANHTIIHELVDMLDGEERFSDDRWVRSIGVGEFILSTAAYVEMFGYLSATKCREQGYGLATGSTVFQFETSPKRRKEYFDTTDDEQEFRAKHTDKSVRQLACATLYWLGELQERSSGDLNDYFHNLSTASGLGYVVERSANIVASAIVAFKREYRAEIDRTRQSERKPSKYFGKIKKRYDFEVEINYTNCWEGNFGLVHFYHFYGPDDQAMVWFGSRCLVQVIEPEDSEDHCRESKALDEGDKFWVRATVKRHEVREGIKQTILTRVALLDGPPKKKKKKGKG